VSTVSNIPLFGQAWELTVQYAVADGTTTSEVVTSDTWEPEALRMTFEVVQSMLPSPWWFADIVIYNLDTPEIQNILLNATWVTLKAGFQTGPTLSSVIWDGPILQVLFDREAVVDFRVTLHCVSNPFVMDDIVSFSMGPFASQAQLIAKMADEINLPPINASGGTLSTYASQVMTAKQYPRGNTVFGKISKYLIQVADDQFMSTWRDGSKAYVSEIGDATKTNSVLPDYVYSPSFPPNLTPPQLPAGTTQSIIGTPRQTPFGAVFTVLLDPRLKVQLPPLIAQLSRTLITQIPVQPGQTSSSPMSSNLNFFVAQVRHIGDSRGNDWYTEVTGYNTTYASNLLDGVFAASSSGT
jgi:hypothetical protein